MNQYQHEQRSHTNKASVKRPHLPHLTVSCCLLALAINIACTPVSAADINWTGNTSNDWFDASNWQVGILPTGKDDIHIDDTVGSIMVNGGRTASAVKVYIGDNLNTKSSVTVTGAGSLLDNKYFSIGNSGSGSLTITDGATVTNSIYSLLGISPGSKGSATVTGAGSLWETNNLTVGSSGSGSLTIADGARVTSLGNLGSGSIGLKTGSEGSVTVTGIGSSWVVSNDISVGYLGSGSLIIADGAVVTSGNATDIGTMNGSEGSAIVTGIGSLWNAKSLIVGRLGSATLTIADGATVSISADSYGSHIGYGTNSKGLLTVTGAGSSLETNDLTIGGAGTLAVADGATVNISNVFTTKGTLNIEAGNTQPAVMAQAAVISSNAVLNISGYSALASATASEVANNWMTVIQTSAPGNLTGEFASVNIGGSETPVDYLTLTYLSDTQRFQVGMGLTWYAGETALPQNAHGTFTLADAREFFNLDVALVDVAANAQTSWDGTSLTKTGYGTLILSSDNTYTGGTTISGGTLQLGNGGTEGSVVGNIVNEGSLVVNRSDTYTYDGIISGNGSLTQQGHGSLVLGQSQSYTGTTGVNAGALILFNNAQLTSTQAVTVANGATLGGYGGVGGDVINNGRIAVGDASGFTCTPASTRTSIRIAPLSDTFLIGGNLTNSGEIDLSGTSSGSTLAIAGNYISNNGLLTLNTVLGGDDSMTDKLVVLGNTSGTTQVVVNNTQGGGAQTVNGIEVIRVNGQSDGQFSLANRVVAGAYEYQLSQGLPTQADGNWYLSSMIPDSSKTSVYRAEAGSYLTNMAAASSLFNLRLADREGRAENSSLWLRQVGTHNRSRDKSGQLKTTSNRYVIQGGGEVLATQLSGSDRLGVGVMLGYGNVQNHTDAAYSRYSSEGSLNGYTAGLYATWYQDVQSLNGLYVDTWAQYSELNAKVAGDELKQQSYDIHGVSASVESGYRQRVYQGVNGDVFITPQGQVIWSDMNADDATEANGTRIQSGGNGNLQTRLGVKLSRSGVANKDKGTHKLFTTYVEANWLYNSHQANTILDDVEVEQAGSRHIGEVKLGMEGQLNEQTHMWTQVAQQLGTKGYSETAVMVGVKYQF